MLCVISGFWKKDSTYEEQPVVKFRYETLLVAATSTQGDFVAWSTFPHLNNMLETNLRMPAVSVRHPENSSDVKECGFEADFLSPSFGLQVREEDQNQDGKLDLLVFQLQLPLKAQEQVYSVQLLLTFSYQLFVRSPLQCLDSDTDSHQPSWNYSPVSQTQNQKSWLRNSFVKQNPALRAFFSSALITYTQGLYEFLLQSISTSKQTYGPFLLVSNEGWTWISGVQCFTGQILTSNEFCPSFPLIINSY